jgi:hypothetical protein
VVHTPGCLLFEARKHHTDAKYCFLQKLMKGEVSNIMDSEENLSKIYRSFFKVPRFNSFGKQWYIIMLIIDKKVRGKIEMMGKRGRRLNIFFTVYVY